jgi:hypothetical protein
VKLFSVPFYKQEEIHDCGITCIKMVSEYFDKVLSLAEIKSYYNTVWNRPLYTTELSFILNEIGLDTKIYTSNLDYNDLSEYKINENELSDIFIEERKISTTELPDFLNLKTIIIVLLDYGVLIDSEEKMTHFAPITGFDGDNFYIHSHEESFKKIGVNLFTKSRESDSTDWDIIVVKQK